MVKIAEVSWGATYIHMGNLQHPHGPPELRVPLVTKTQSLVLKNGLKKRAWIKYAPLSFHC